MLAPFVLGLGALVVVTLLTDLTYGRHTGGF